MDYELDPLTGDPLPKSAAPAANAAQGTLDSATIEKLGVMSKEELISLVRRVGGAMWGIGLMTNDERREAKKLRMSVIALTSKDNYQVLKACNDWLDREEGKSIQRIDQRVLHAGRGVAGDMTSAELLAAVRGLADAGRLPGNVKMLDDGKLEVVDAEFEEVTLPIDS